MLHNPIQPKINITFDTFILNFVNKLFQIKLHRII